MKYYTPQILGQLQETMHKKENEDEINKLSSFLFLN